MDEQRPEPLSEDPAVQSGTALRELAARLLALPDPYDQTTAPPSILVGQLPEDLPVEIPIPDGTVVIGSTARDLSRRNGRRFQIVLDADAPAERFRETYRQLLLTSGWNEDQERPRRSGFVPRRLPMLFRVPQWFPRLRRRLGLDRPEIPSLFRVGFRLGPRGPKLAVYVQDRRNAPTDVHLILFAGQREARPRHDPAWAVIPRLYSPPGAREQPEDERTGVLAPPFGARQLGGNWGGGGRRRWEPDGAYSYVALEFDSDLAAIAAHYTVQFEEAGWSRTDGGQGGPQAWSTWTFADERERPWTGAFTALRLPEAPEGAPNRYLLQVHAGRTPDR